MKASRKSALKRGLETEKKFYNGLVKRGFVADQAKRSLRDLPIHRPPQFCGTCHKMIAFRISAKHDTFGMFDIIAKHHEFADYTFYFQVKMGEWASGQKRIDLENFPRGQYDVICMVRKMPRLQFQIRWLDPFCKTIQWVEHHDAADFIDSKKFLNPSAKFQKAVNG